MTLHSAITYASAITRISLGNCPHSSVISQCEAFSKAILKVPDVFMGKFVGNYLRQ